MKRLTSPRGGGHAFHKGSYKPPPSILASCSTCCWSWPWTWDLVLGALQHTEIEALLAISHLPLQPQSVNHEEIVRIWVMCTRWKFHDTLFWGSYLIERLSLTSLWCCRNPLLCECREQRRWRKGRPLVSDWRPHESYIGPIFKWSVCFPCKSFRESDLFSDISRHRQVSEISLGPRRASREYNLHPKGGSRFSSAV